MDSVCVFFMDSVLVNKRTFSLSSMDSTGQDTVLELSVVESAHIHIRVKSKTKLNTVCFLNSFRLCLSHAAKLSHC